MTHNVCMLSIAVKQLHIYVSLTIFCLKLLIFCHNCRHDRLDIELSFGHCLLQVFCYVSNLLRILIIVITAMTLLNCGFSLVMTGTKNCAMEYPGHEEVQGYDSIHQHVHNMCRFHQWSFMHDTILRGGPCILHDGQQILQHCRTAVCA